MGMRRGPRSGTRLNRAPEERKKIGRLAFIFDLSGDFVLKLDLHLGWTLTSTGAGSKIAQQGRLGRRKSRRTLSEYDHAGRAGRQDRKSTRLNSSHTVISYAVFCLKKKKK